MLKQPLMIQVGDRFVETMNQETSGFWDRMGRFFASASVRAALGAPMSSDESYTWVVATENHTSAVAGFAALKPARNGAAVLCHDYVLPHEQAATPGLHRDLIEVICRVARDSGVKILTTVQEDKLCGLFTACGFEPGTARGKYRTFSRSFAPAATSSPQEPDAA